jgi:hypothetical protein
MSYGKYVGFATVLKQVNEAREAMGLDPIATLPRGVRLQHNRCPIANAIDNSCRVSTSMLFLYDQQIEGDVDKIAADIAMRWGTTCSSAGMLDGLHATVELPDALRTFVARFDSGKIPK